MKHEIFLTLATILGIPQPNLNNDQNFSHASPNRKYYNYIIIIVIIIIPPLVVVI